MMVGIVLGMVLAACGGAADVVEGASEAVDDLGDESVFSMEVGLCFDDEDETAGNRCARDGINHLTMDGDGHGGLIGGRKGRGDERRGAEEGTAKIAGQRAFHWAPP